jgi:hypothetical protein
MMRWLMASEGASGTGASSFWAILAHRTFGRATDEVIHEQNCRLGRLACYWHTGAVAELAA